MLHEKFNRTAINGKLTKMPPNMFQRYQFEQQKNIRSDMFANLVKHKATAQLCRRINTKNKVVHKIEKSWIRNKQEETIKNMTKDTNTSKYELNLELANVGIDSV